MKFKSIAYFKIIFSFSIIFSQIACKENEYNLTDVKEMPNIIFIMADDLGYAELGSYNQQLIRTPNLDQMADEGMRFTQCYSGSSVCAPARSVLMTGMHTGRTRVRGNFGIGGVKGLAGINGRVPLKKNDVTLAEVLKSKGYATGMVGKWGLGEPNTEGEPNSQGFDEFFGFLNQRRAHHYYPDYLWRNREKVMLTGNKDAMGTDYSHDLFANEALDFIKRKQNVPFFLYIPLCIPHNNYEVPEYGIYSNENWSADAKAYAAMISRMDHSVGRILKSLKDFGIDENTIVFFTSDNGAAGSPKAWNLFNSNAPFRGIKRDPYEGGIRVPMIARYPNKIAAASTNNLPWYFADVMPTLTDLTGAVKPEGLDGTSVLPTLMGKKQDFSERPMYWEFYEKSGWRAVRFGDWKAIEHDMHNSNRRPIEIYNIKNDIRETINLALERPDIVKKAKEYFDSLHEPSKQFVWKNINE